MRVLIVDDHNLFVVGVRAVASSCIPGCDVYGATTIDEAVQLCSSALNPDLALVDIQLSGLSGLVVFDLLRSRYHDLPMAFISGYASPRTVSEALKRDLRGFVDKRETAEGIATALRQLLAGEVYFSPRIGQAINKCTTDVPRLTHRQADILALMAQGLLNKQISDRLGCSENTVKVHIRSLYHALNVHNRAACLRVAQVRGLIDVTN